MEFVILIFLVVYVVAHIIQSGSPHTQTMRGDGIEYVITDCGDVIECDRLRDVIHLDKIDMVISQDPGIFWADEWDKDDDFDC